MDASSYVFIHNFRLFPCFLQKQCLFNHLVCPPSNFLIYLLINFSKQRLQNSYEMCLYTFHEI